MSSSYAAFCLKKKRPAGGTQERAGTHHAGALPAPEEQSHLRGRSRRWKDFFFNDTATTEIYTLSLHDALPISPGRRGQGDLRGRPRAPCRRPARPGPRAVRRDRKRTRLNSSHMSISYAVFCLKKKNKFENIFFHRFRQKKNRNNNF